MTEDDVRRIIREEIDRARHLAPREVAVNDPRLIPPHNPYPPQPLPMPPYWYMPATCGGGSTASGSGGGHGGQA